MGRLILAGAGHAHLDAIQAIPAYTAQGHTVTAVSLGERHYYSGMGAGMLGGAYRSEEISFPVRKMVEARGGTFIQDKVVAIDAARSSLLLASGAELVYDVLSCNLGSIVPNNLVQGEGRGVFTVKPVENLLAVRKEILNLAERRTVRLGICGGGPSALEVAGNAVDAGRQGAGVGCSVQIFTSGDVLKNMPDKVRRLARERLGRKGIQTVAGSRVRAVETGLVHLEGGLSHAQDIVVLALGVRPPMVFADSGLPAGLDGGLLVNQFLQSTAHPNVFGGGDCVFFEPSPLAKVGVYAVRQGPVLSHNTLAMLEGRPLRAFDPGGSYLLVFNTGGGQGIFHRNGVAFAGRSAFWIKNIIDRRFMRKFQIHQP